MTLYSPISSIYSRRAEQQPLSAGLKSAAASTLSPSVLLLSTSTRSWMGFYQHSHFPCWCCSLSQKQSKSPGQCIFHILLSDPGQHDRLFSSQFLAPVFWIFTVLLPRRLPLRSDLGKWNVVIEEKVQIGSGCKWSLVSGRRFLFRR